MAKDDMHICRNHKDAFMYRGDVCPWCDFALAVETRLYDEYKRGFEDGVRAVETEAAKQKAEVKVADHTPE